MEFLPILIAPKTGLQISVYDYLGKSIGTAHWNGVGWLTYGPNCSTRLLEPTFWWHEGLIEGLRENLVAYGLLSGEKKQLLQYFKGKGKLERYTSKGTWSPNQPTWGELKLNYVYRVAKDIKPSIDWSQVSDNYNWLAMDKDGFAWLYEDKPELSTQSWSNGLKTIAPANAFKSFNPGNCSWQGSLVQR